MFVRLAFAVAINIEPEILIVDEALSVGDEQFKNKCITKINKLIKKENVTLLFVTHSTATATEFCKRGLIMKKGKLIFDGDIKDAEVKYKDMIKNKKL